MSSIQVITSDKWRIHTNLSKIVNIIPDYITRRKWILTNWEGNKNPNGYTIDQQKIVLNGEELLSLFDHDFQLIWGVLSGGSDKLLESQSMPFCETNDEIWKPFYKMQNENADIEILAWDGKYTLITANENTVLEEIRSKIGVDTVYYTNCLQNYNHYYSGLTVNEMLYKSGLDKEFYNARKKHNRSKMKEILSSLGLLKEQVDVIAGK